LTAARLSKARSSTGFELAERAVAPELALNFVARHHFAAALRQEGQQLDRLRRELDELAIAPKFGTPSVELEGAKPQDGRRGCLAHGGSQIIGNLAALSENSSPTHLRPWRCPVQGRYKSRHQGGNDDNGSYVDTPLAARCLFRTGVVALCRPK